MDDITPLTLSYGTYISLKDYNKAIDFKNKEYQELALRHKKICDDWQELKQIIKNYKYTNTCHCYSCNKELCDIILDKMKELEENGSTY